MRCGLGAAQGSRELEQLAHRHLEGRRQLRHEANHAQHFGALVAWVAAIDLHRAVMDVFAQQTTDQRGFAGTIGANQRHTLAQPTCRSMLSRIRARRKVLVTV